MSKTEDMAAKLTSMANAAGVAEMSKAELRNYVGAQEDRMLESADPLQREMVHATRRARKRAVQEKDVPFGKLIAEEMEIAMKIGLKAKGK
jgi:hypothetical protein